ncbi:uncharacterized protein LOC132067657 [Lycium ferocissimum]|uniref:uncharacterized protein LOC132067657 n=1 Tax=Lycium ferocissimum TaxID=112874 RepID=UPI0028153457|nr:uncharacterized protein LOC132067657 [Lycium ferocissimum]
MTTPYNLVVIIKNPSNEDEFLLVKQTPPPKFNDPEYHSFLDSPLWDLPSSPLLLLDSPSDNNQIFIQVPDSCSNEVDLSKFDLNSALHKVLKQVELEDTTVEWKFLKYAQEPEFGPGLPVKTVYIIGTLGPKNGKFKDVEFCKWMSIERCTSMLVEVKPCSDRVGSLVVVGLLNDSKKSGTWKIPPTLQFQEYPLGVKVIPMESRTAKPFRTTNLIVFLPGGDASGRDDSFIAHGEALIVDPGCKSASYEQLKEIIAVLPRKLVVFVTHHHNDHVDGLSVVQKYSPDACLLAHENTIRRIRKDAWSLPYVSVSGSEEICIGNQRLRIISAPGHTDGHMALLHVSTNSLIVGDHCVGQGSALLDMASGGNMKDYFQTTYKFIELSPHALIPMHGRTNMWPKHMLSGYLKNRRHRESTILKAIESGAKTLYDIVAYTYADVDRSLWFYASSNVRLHVEHLALQDKLPNVFSIQKFQATCGLRFLFRWILEYSSSAFSIKHHTVKAALLVGTGAMAIGFFALSFSTKRQTFL